MKSVSAGKKSRSLWRKAKKRSRRDKRVEIEEKQGPAHKNRPLFMGFLQEIMHCRLASAAVAPAVVAAEEQQQDDDPAAVTAAVASVVTAAVAPAVVAAEEQQQDNPDTGTATVVAESYAIVTSTSTVSSS